MGAQLQVCSTACSNKTQLNQQMMPDSTLTRVRVDDTDSAPSNESAGGGQDKKKQFKQLQTKTKVGFASEINLFLSPSAAQTNNNQSLERSMSFLKFTAQKSTRKFVRMNTDYNENCVVQSAAAGELESWVQTSTIELGKSGVLDKNQNLQFCEFGCATGGDSVGILQAIIDGLDDAAFAAGDSDRDSKRVVSACMNDLPLNNWEVTSSTLEPIFSPRIRFTYSKQCMYERAIVETPGVMHIGVSTLAQHWLRKGVPSKLPADAIWGNQLPLGDAQRLLWEQAARRDWTRFLELRGREFCPGGFLLLHIQSSRLDGSLSETAAETLAQAKAELVKEGSLTDSEAAALAMPEYAKSPAEILDVLRTPEMTKLWLLKDMRFMALPCPYAEAEADSNSSAERIAMVEEAVAQLRSFMNASLISKIGKSKTDLFFQRVQQIAGSDTSRIALSVSIVFLRLQRRA
eukprot:CAMPEP_0202693814 /NCGR_PEP_ID=MMETSP1385-20130828/7834_1 /ASSEMBLY_ACC=CAM_ASM_000861 /TAXON_ID=933848 /ORGANISM="Elphidium margaritaceum" /LENGTH=459 /DNA_ID=CAMNT_0049349551 /DNA_START=62 /DNA_END=1441 /DNA_ORIENTATION=+